MKNCFKVFFAALMALAMFVPAQANEELTICNDNRTSSYIPFRPIDFQDDGMHSQLIYPAEKLAEMNGQQINSIKFYLQDGMYAANGQLLVKMGETANAVYASAADFRTDLVEVAAMPLTEGVTELVIDLSTPYTYLGGNLVIDFTNPEQGDDNFYGWNHWYGETADYYSAIGSNGAMDKFLPKATFDYGVPQEWDAKVTPLELTFNLPAEREEVQTITILNKGQNAFTPVFGTLNDALSIDVEAVELAMGQKLEVPVKFAPAVAGDYSTTLTINCGNAGAFEVVINAIATDPVYEVVVGDKTTSDEFLPFYTYYFDVEGTLGQMIYTEEMMGAAKGNKITKVTFHPTKALLSSVANGKVQLSFKNVGEQVGFDEAVALTEMTAQATYTFVGGETELTFVLDEPYEYNGGSLALEAVVLESTSFSHNAFYGNKYDYNPSFYHYVSTTTTYNKMSTFLPMTTFTYDKASTPEPQVIRGDVDGDENVSVADATALIDILLSGGTASDAADANLDHEVSIADVTAIIDYLLSGTWAD